MLEKKICVTQWSILNLPICKDRIYTFEPPKDRIYTFEPPKDRIYTFAVCKNIMQINILLLVIVYD